MDPIRGFGMYDDIKYVGKVTSAVYSPRLKKILLLAMVDINIQI
jgi:glycine cleavage system aminomethyltransferase T